MPQLKTQISEATLLHTLQLLWLLWLLWLNSGCSGADLATLATLATWGRVQEAGETWRACKGDYRRAKQDRLLSTLQFMTVIMFIGMVKQTFLKLKNVHNWLNKISARPLLIRKVKKNYKLHFDPEIEICFFINKMFTIFFEGLVWRPSEVEVGCLLS